MKLPLLMLMSLPFSTPLISTIPRDEVPEDPDRNLYSTIQNDIDNTSPCRAMTLIFARGTNQNGNLGEYPGWDFVHAIAGSIGEDKLSVQGVNYRATTPTFLKGGDMEGARMMWNLTNVALEQCPDTKLVLGGYSQGGQVIHLMMKEISPSIADKISSIVIFGDPLSYNVVERIDPSKVLIICHAEDYICKGSTRIGPEHSNYQKDVPAAADFVIKAAGIDPISQ